MFGQRLKPMPPLDESPPSRHRAIRSVAGAAAILVLVTLVYWPVAHGGFVWDDIINFIENDWLSRGSQWQHYVLRDFNGWTNYFRPLVVAFFTLQIRLFDGSPGAMHLVSLGLHLINIVLVGWLASCCAKVAQVSARARWSWPLACMVIYGLHPVLLEAVAWIGCQFDLIATMFMLLGTLAAVTMQAKAWRSLAVATCFFLAACSKESAALFPAMVLLVDWLVQARQSPEIPNKGFLRYFADRNLPLLIALLLAGGTYLLFRAWGLGYLVQHTTAYGGEVSILGAVQKVAYTGLQYLKATLFPFVGINPIHSLPSGKFDQTDFMLLGFAALAVLVLAAATWAVFWRRCAWGGLLVMATIALLPVLNLLPTGFAVSLYHERYAINALAFGVVLLPLLAWPQLRWPVRRLQTLILATIAELWLVASVATIRGYLPSWLDDEKLWRWAVAGNPRHEISQYNLTAALLANGKQDEANAYVDRFFDGGECARCALIIAVRELDRGHVERASELIERARVSDHIIKDRDVFGRYLLAAGQLEAAQNRPVDAISLITEGMKITSDDLSAHVALAESLLKTGQRDEAIAIARRAIGIAIADNAADAERWFDNFMQRADAERE